MAAASYGGGNLRGGPMGSQGGGGGRGYSGPQGLVGPSDRGLAMAGMRPSGMMGRMNDYADKGNTGLENIGNALATAVGFNEMKPKPGYSSQNRANWGFDPAGLIGGAVGMGVGAPGLGLLADMASRAMGRPLEMNMGPSVFGGGGGGGLLGGPPGAGGGGMGLLNGPPPGSTGGFGGPGRGVMPQPPMMPMGGPGGQMPVPGRPRLPMPGGGRF